MHDLPKYSQLTGLEFNKSNNRILFKVLNDKENHYNYQFVDDLNTDTKKFNPNDSCQAGGIFF